jgi:hypothetical protein
VLQQSVNLCSALKPCKYFPRSNLKYRKYNSEWCSHQGARRLNLHLEMIGDCPTRGHLVSAPCLKERKWARLWTVSYFRFYWSNNKMHGIVNGTTGHTLTHLLYYISERTKENETYKSVNEISWCFINYIYCLAECCVLPRVLPAY